MLDMDLTNARISEYEQSKREPNLLVVLRNARVADVSVEDLIDDALSLSALRKK